MRTTERVDPFSEAMDDWLAVMQAGDPSRPHDAGSHRADLADPSRRPELWLGRHAGYPVAAGQVDLVPDGWAFVMVDRARRREGHGAAMADHLVERGRQAGLDRLVSAVILAPGGGQGRLDFAAGQGWQVGDRYGTWLLDLAGPDGRAATKTPPPLAGALAAPYACRLWVDEPPADLMAARVGLQRGFEQDVPGSRDQTRPWDAETLRAHLTGGTHGTHVVEAVALAGEETVGFSTLLVREGQPQAQQKDTFVVPAHRGKGLGRALKQATVAQVRRRWPHVREVRTFVNRTNASMQQVNEGLGYRLVAEMVELVRPLGGEVRRVSP